MPIAQPLDSQQLALRLSLEQWREELEAESKHFPSVVLYVEHKLRETFELFGPGNNYEEKPILLARRRWLWPCA